jgi:hypothetical protein
MNRLLVGRVLSLGLLVVLVVLALSACGGDEKIAHFVEAGGACIFYSAMAGPRPPARVFFSLSQRLSSLADVGPPSYQTTRW